MKKENKSPQWQSFIIDTVLEIIKIGNRFFILILIIFTLSSLFRIWFSDNQFNGLWNILGFDFRNIIDLSITSCILVIFVLVIINLINLLPYEILLRILKKNRIITMHDVTHEGYLSYAYPIEHINTANLKELTFDIQKVRGTYWRSSLTIRGKGYEKLSFQIYEGDSEPTRSVVNNLGFLQVQVFIENRSEYIQLPEMFLKPDVLHNVKLSYKDKLLEISIDNTKLFCTEILLSEDDFLALNTWADKEPKWSYRIDFKNIKVRL